MTKVLLDDRSKRAYGVRFRRDGKLWEVRARKGGYTYDVCNVTILEGAEVRIGFYGRGGRILRGVAPRLIPTSEDRKIL